MMEVPLDIDNVTISNNKADGSAGSGGGLLNSQGGTTNLAYSTISGNSSAGNGGGAYNNSGMTIVNATTVANNTAANSGGGIFNNGGQTNLLSSIVAENSAQSTGPEISGSGFVSNGFNLIQRDPEGSISFLSSDKSGDAELLPLADNGGGTQTHAINCNSIAVAMGNPGDNSNAQNGQSVFNGQRDIGSFEFGGICNTEPVAELPTMSEWRLIILGTLLMIVGIFYIRYWDKRYDQGLIIFHLLFI